MTVLDAYAVIAYLRGESVADEVADILRAATVLSAANAAEIIDQLVRVHGRDADDVHGDLALLTYAGSNRTGDRRDRDVRRAHSSPSLSPNGHGGEPRGLHRRRHGR